MENNYNFIIKDRSGKKIKPLEKQNKSLEFLYGTLFGRLILKILTRPFVSKAVGAYLNSRLSTKMINSFIEKNNINIDDFENKVYSSYNDFFFRKIKKEKRKIDLTDDAFISPCDSKLTAYKINSDSVFRIKEGLYTVSDLLGGNDFAQNKAKEYKNGYCLIFRLAVDDYHRYCYIDSGTKTENTFIKGVLHTVNPIALNSYNFYKRNCREYTTLTTNNFGNIIQIEIGAMMVGKITNLHNIYQFKKGEEKGFFEFGGSTIVLLIKDNYVELDPDILKNTAEFAETVVHYGEKIGKKSKTKL